MKRKLILVAVLLTTLSMAAFAAGASDAPAAAKPAVVIKISNGINELHPTYLACKEFERIVESKLPGKYDVQVYANAQLGDDVRATEGRSEERRVRKECSSRWSPDH